MLVECYTSHQTKSNIRRTKFEKVYWNTCVIFQDKYRYIDMNAHTALQSVCERQANQVKLYLFASQHHHTISALGMFSASAATVFVTQIRKPPSVLTSPVTSSCRVRSGWPRSMLFLISSFPVPGPDNKSQPVSHRITLTLKHTQMWRCVRHCAHVLVFLCASAVSWTVSSAVTDLFTA